MFSTSRIKVVSNVCCVNLGANGSVFAGCHSTWFTSSGSKHSARSRLERTGKGTFSLFLQLSKGRSERKTDAELVSNLAKSSCTSYAEERCTKIEAMSRNLSKVQLPVNVSQKVHS